MSSKQPVPGSSQESVLPVVMIPKPTQPIEFPDVRNPRDWFSFIRNSGHIFDVDISTASVTSLMMHVDSVAFYQSYSTLISEFDSILARSRLVAAHVRSIFRRRRAKRALMQMSVDELIAACETNLRPTILGRLPKLGPLGVQVFERLAISDPLELRMVLPLLDEPGFLAFIDRIVEVHQSLRSLRFTDSQLLSLWDSMIWEKRCRGSPFSLSATDVRRMLTSLFQDRPREFTHFFSTIHPTVSRRGFNLSGNIIPLAKSDQKFVSIYIDLLLRFRPSIIIDRINFLSNLAHDPFFDGSLEAVGFNILNFLGRTRSEFLIGRSLSKVYRFYNFPDSRLIPLSDTPDCFRLKSSPEKALESSLPSELAHFSSSEFQELGLEPLVEVRFGQQCFSVCPIEAKFYHSSSPIFSQNAGSRVQGHLKYMEWAFFSNDPAAMDRCIMVLTARTRSCPISKTTPFSDFIDPNPYLTLTSNRVQFITQLVDAGGLQPMVAVLTLLKVYAVNEREREFDSSLDALLRNAVLRLLTLASASDLAVLHQLNFSTSCFSQAKIHPIRMDQIHRLLRCPNVISDRNRKLPDQDIYPTHLALRFSLSFIKDIISQIAIDCDYSRVSFGVYSLFEALFVFNRVDLGSSSHFVWEDRKGCVATVSSLQSFIISLSDMEFDVFLALLRVGKFKPLLNPLDISSHARFYCAIRNRVLAFNYFGQASFTQAPTQKHNVFSLQSIVANYFISLSSTSYTDIPSSLKSLLKFQHFPKLVKYASYRKALSQTVCLVSEICSVLEPELEKQSKLANTAQRLYELSRKTRPSDDTEVNECLSTLRSLQVPGPQLQLLKGHALSFISEMSFDLLPQVKNALLVCMKFTKLTDFPHCKKSNSVGFRFANVTANAASVYYHRDDEIADAMWKMFSQNTFQAGIFLNVFTRIASVSSNTGREAMVQRAMGVLSQSDLGLVVAKQLYRLLFRISSSGYAVSLMYDRWYSQKVGIGLRATFLHLLFDAELPVLLADLDSFFESRFFNLLQGVFSLGASVVHALTSTICYVIVRKLGSSSLVSPCFLGHLFDLLSASFRRNFDATNAEKQQFIEMLLTSFDHCLHEPYISRAFSEFVYPLYIDCAPRFIQHFGSFTDEAFGFIPTAVASLPAVVSPADDELPELTSIRSFLFHIFQSTPLSEMRRFPDLYLDHLKMLCAQGLPSIQILQSLIMLVVDSCSLDLEDKVRNLMYLVLVPIKVIRPLATVGERRAISLSNFIPVFKALDILYRPRLLSLTCPFTVRADCSFDEIRADIEPFITVMPLDPKQNSWIQLAKE